MQIDNDYSWSTHAPLLNALLQIFNPNLITELGLGIHSTPLFLQSSAHKLIFVENDQSWFDHMTAEFSFDDRCETILHDLGAEIQLGTKLRELTDVQKKSIVDFYQQLSKKIKDTDRRFLFVDNFACARNLAINTLYDHFDVIVYHDCQPKGIKWYEYNFSKDLYDRYDQYILVCNSAWTGCFVKKNLFDKDLLKKTLQPFIEDFCKKNNVNVESMYLQ